MGLGLPLMQSLTVDEFKGVLAHEFGHYHAGDVALGPWIYKTRAAIGRTIAQLSDNVLRFIFIAYANLFLRVTHAVSRRQEFIADEVGASVAGAAAMASGLRKVGAAAVLYQSYWHNELLPVVQAGFRPPVTWGFARYSADPGLAIPIRLCHRIDKETSGIVLFAKGAMPLVRSATLRRAVVVRERRATFSVAPGQPARPPTRTGSWDLSICPT